MDVLLALLLAIPSTAFITLGIAANLLSNHQYKIHMEGYNEGYEVGHAKGYLDAYETFKNSGDSMCDVFGEEGAE